MNKVVHGKKLYIRLQYPDSRENRNFVIRGNLRYAIPWERWIMIDTKEKYSAD